MNGCRPEQKEYQGFQFALPTDYVKSPANWSYFSYPVLSLFFHHLHQRLFSKILTHLMDVFTIMPALLTNCVISFSCTWIFMKKITKILDIPCSRCCNKNYDTPAYCILYLVWAHSVCGIMTFELRWQFSKLFLKYNISSNSSFRWSKNLFQVVMLNAKVVRSQLGQKTCWFLLSQPVCLVILSQFGKLRFSAECWLTLFTWVEHWFE